MVVLAWLLRLCSCLKACSIAYTCGVIAIPPVGTGLALQSSHSLQFSQVDLLLAPGAPISQQLRQLRQGVDIVVGTPGRVQDIQERGELSLAHVRNSFFCLQL